MDGPVWFLVYVASVVVAFLIGASKGRPGFGFLLGLFLSWVGVFFLAIARTPGEAEIEAKPAD